MIRINAIQPASRSRSAPTVTSIAPLVKAAAEALCQAGHGGSGAYQAQQQAFNRDLWACQQLPPTDTPIPPTDTPVPPTNTPVPPTNTSIPPTNSPMPQQQQQSNAPVQTKPGRATNLTAALAGNAVALSWSAPADGGQVSAYRIWRRLPDRGESALGVLVNNTGSAATSFADGSVMAGQKHIYRVQALNSAGEGQRSLPSEIVVKAAPPTNTPMSNGYARPADRHANPNGYTRPASRRASADGHASSPANGHAGAANQYAGAANADSTNHAGAARTRRCRRPTHRFRQPTRRFRQRIRRFRRPTRRFRPTRRCRRPTRQCRRPTRRSDQHASATNEYANTAADQHTDSAATGARPQLNGVAIRRLGRLELVRARRRRPGQRLPHLAPSAGQGREEVRRHCGQHGQRSDQLCR